MAEKLIKRPLFVMAGSFFAAMVLAYPLGKAGKIITMILFGLLAVLSLVLAVKRRNKGWKTAFLATTAVIVALVVSLLWFDVYLGSLERFAGEDKEIKATVIEDGKTTSYSTSAKIRIDEAGGEKARIGARLFLEEPVDLKSGDVIALKAEIAFPTETEYGFPLKKYEFSKGVMLYASSDGSDILVKDGEKASTGGIIASARKFAEKRFVTLLGERNAGFVKAILLGDREGLGDSMKRDFRRLGLSHILAISGLHLSILAGALEKLLVALRLKKWLRTLILSGFLVFFSALTGFSSSVLRASIMLFIYYLGFLFSAEPDRFTSLALAGALICLCDPPSAVDCGLQLSLFATFGLIIFAGERKERKPIKRIRSGALRSLSPLITTLPLMWIYFREISLVSPLANLIFGLPVTVVLYLAPILLLTPFVSPVSRAVGFVVSLIRKMAGIAPLLRGVTLPLGYPFVPYAILTAVLCALATLFLKNRKKTSLLIPLVSFFAVYGVSLLVFKSVFGSDTSVILSGYKNNDMLAIGSGRATVVCDFGDGSYKPMRNIAELAETEFCTDEIDLFVLTHYHQRHASSFISLAENYYVRSVALPEPISEKEEGIAFAIESSARERGIEVAFFDADGTEEIKTGFATLSAPGREYLKRSTHPLVGIGVEAEGKKFFYLGASYAETETNKEFLSDALENGDAVVLGIHGPVNRIPFDLSERKGYVISRNEAFSDADELFCPDEEDYFRLIRLDYASNIKKVLTKQYGNSE